MFSLFIKKQQLINNKTFLIANLIEEEMYENALQNCLWLKKK